MRFGYPDKFLMIYRYPYTEILNWQDQSLPNMISLQDHLGGYTQDMYNVVLDRLNTLAGQQGKKQLVRYHSILEQTVTSRYPNLDIVFDHKFQDNANLKALREYNIHPELDFKNFVCSFNGKIGRAHV